MRQKRSHDRHARAKDVTKNGVHDASRKVSEKQEKPEEKGSSSASTQATNSTSVLLSYPALWAPESSSLVLLTVIVIFSRINSCFFRINIDSSPGPTPRNKNCTSLCQKAVFVSSRRHKKCQRRCLSKFTCSSPKYWRLVISGDLLVLLFKSQVESATMSTISKFGLVASVLLSIASGVRVDHPSVASAVHVSPLQALLEKEQQYWAAQDKTPEEAADPSESEETDLLQLTGNCPVIIANQKYRLTNSFTGAGKSLDVINDGINDQLQLAPTGRYSGQSWTLRPVSGQRSYYLYNDFTGPSKVLDVVNAGSAASSTQLVLSTIGRYSGQYWTLTLIDSGDCSYRLTNDFTGPTKALDVVNAGSAQRSTQVVLAQTARVSGQMWFLTPSY
eukprot:g51115.t1